MYLALDIYVMLDVLKFSSLSCPSDDTWRSTKKILLSLRVMYNEYSECTLGPWTRRMFPRWNIHPPKEKSARMLASSSYPTEISDRSRSGTCSTPCRTNLEPLGYSVLPIRCRLLRSVESFQHRPVWSSYPYSFGTVTGMEHAIGSTGVEKPACGILHS